MEKLDDVKKSSESKYPKPVKQEEKASMKDVESEKVAVVSDKKIGKCCVCEQEGHWAGNDR